MRAEQVAATLQDALRAVRSADIPEELQEVAFAKAVDLLGSGVANTPAPGSPSQPSSPVMAASAGAAAGSCEARIAAAVGVPEEAIGYLFTFDEDRMSLSVARDRLEADRIAAQRQVALLICAGRQLAGMEERTHSDEIRAAAEDLGLVRKNTFREEMGKLGPIVAAQQKGRFGRAFRLTQAGRREASDLLQRLAAEHL